MRNRIMVKDRAFNRWRLLAIVGLILSLSLDTLGEFSRTVAAADFANEAFQTAWEQLDGPVVAGQVARPYLWGTPGPILNENYKEAKGGQRQVQYFAKGRMELTRPDAQPGFVGDGRLVLEMVSGRLQTGDNSYLQFDGCESPIAGANRFEKNPGAPSYRAFQSLVGQNASQVGTPIRAVLTEPEAEGFFLGFYSLNPDNALGTLAKNAVYIPESAHNIPDVFWNYLNQPDANGLPLFNWQTLFGLPLTDAYWAKLRGADGASQDTLVQLFERRTLLYNPAAASGFQVESGDVGTDYYRWRYQLPELPIIEDKVEPSSGSGQVQPSVGESGSTFILTGSNFKPNEKVSAWIEQKVATAPVNTGPGVFEQPVRINDQGRFRLRLRTNPFITPSLLIRLVVLGQESGNKIVLNFRVVGSIRYTPAVEAIQPSDAPPGISAKVEKSVIKVGESARLQADGFQPGEPLRAWFSTPLNRVVSYPALINRTYSEGTFNRRLVATDSGSWITDIPAPGTPVPGIYAITVYGLQSGKTAIAYFRARTGGLFYYNPFWGAPDPQGPTAAPPPKVDLTKLPLDPALQRNATKLQFEQDDNPTAEEE